MLRLGLRNGYLNLYIKGQSVAKLSAGKNGPSLSVHKAYVTGRRRKIKGNSVPPVQCYQVYDAKELADPATGSLIANWIKTAESHASAEKRFVDDLIAANPGVIDLEMGLPADDLSGGEQAAPRMDLVVAQRAGSEPLSIAFWEAKCANNAELRARGDTEPGVMNQIGKYVRWLSKGARVAEVQQAYRTTAVTLLALNRLFRGDSRSTPECILIWQALAELEAPSVVVRPGIVIGNYCPEGYTESDAIGSIAQSATSFARNGHLMKLDRSGIRVHEVGPGHNGPTLPFLRPVS